MAVVPSIGTKVGSGWNTLLKKASVDGERAADLLADQVRFRITRAGSTSIEHVVPDSRRARELWQDPATRRFMEGVLELSGEVGDDPAPLRGITLATSESGYVLNRAVHHFRPGREPSRAAFAAAIDAAREHTSGAGALRKGRWLHLGPKRSEGLIHALEHPGTPRAELSTRLRTSLGRGVKTLLHELDHVGTPTAPNTRHLDWLREGRAEAFARWPGRVPRAGTALGIDVPTGVGRWADRGPAPYDNEVAAVRALLRMQGIDPKRSRDLDKARGLLGRTPEDQLAAKIADNVARRHAVDAAHGRELRETVRRMVEHEIAPDGSHADPHAVRRLARELDAARRDRVRG
jgi:hypothetical protein